MSSRRLRVVAALVHTYLVALVLVSSSAPRWEGPAASPRPRTNAELVAPHVAADQPLREACRKIQWATFTSSWDAVSEADRAAWQDRDCSAVLRKRPRKEPVSACRESPKATVDVSRKILADIKDKYKGERCALVCNGPSLNRIRWDWQENFKVVMGMNKIFLGLERYNITQMNFLGVANPLVLEQSVQQIVTQLPQNVVKVLSSSERKKYPCATETDNLVFMGSTKNPEFVKDLNSLNLNEGWTVTYWSLQVLYWIGCQEVVIVGMDHKFQQDGHPGKVEVFKGPDVNHFDDSYFAEKKWHLAGLKYNEKFYRIARKVYEAAGRNIIDATVGGRCNIFIKADYNEVMYKRHSSRLLQVGNRTAATKAPAVITGRRGVIGPPRVPEIEGTTATVDSSAFPALQWLETAQVEFGR